MRTRTRVVVVLVVVVGLLLGTVWLVQRTLIYFPDRSAAGPADRAVPGARDLTLRTSDGLTLGAWLVPPAGARDRRVAVLVAPGNAGNRRDRVPLATALAAEGFTVLLFDYRGYGGNPGAPSEDGLARDVRAARDALLEHTDLPVVYLGESLGAAVGTELATEHPPAGLVLRSPFTDLAAVGSAHYPWLPVRLLLRDRFRVADRIGRVDAPTVVVYGTADTIVPPAQSRAVADRAARLARLVAVDGADHNDPSLAAGDPVVRAVVEVAPS